MKVPGVRHGARKREVRMSAGDREQPPYGRRAVLKLAGVTAIGAGLGPARAVARAVSAQSNDNGGSPIDVAIIGAGLSGLTAARDLAAAGNTSFVVIEARDRVGGRTLNWEIGNGHFSEVGGQWIGPGQTAVADLARQLGVGTFPTYYKGKTVVLGGGGKIAVDLDGAFGTDPALERELGELARDVPCGAPWTSPRVAELDPLSVGDWLARHDIRPEDRMGWQSSVSLSGGTPPGRMGLLHYLSMINSAGSDFTRLDGIKGSAQETRIAGGSQVLSIRMAEALGERVRLRSPVRRIAGWDRDVVEIVTDTGTVRARHAIMALSPPLCNQIAFDPPLPPPRTALHRAWPAHSPARKTAMVYARPFWRDKGLNGHIFADGGPIVWAYDNSPAGGEIGIINAFVRNGSIPLAPGEATRVHTQIYAEALGEEALRPIGFHDHDWGFDDPWSITCVSAIPPGFWSTHGPALRPACGRLIWSGTETADVWAGYMDGAVRAGHRAAGDALALLRAAKGGA